MAPPVDSPPITWPTSDAVVCTATFVFALAVRLAFLFQVEAIPVFYTLPGDPRVYDEWAQRIVAGDWVGHGVFYQAPLYAYFLAVLQVVVGHDLWSIRVAQLVLGAAACSLLYLAGRQFYSRPVGLVAAMILTFYAPSLFFSSVVDKTAIDLFLVAVLLVCLGASQAGGQSGVFLAVGLILGLLALSRENTLIWACLMPVWIWACPSSRPRARRVVAGLGLYLLGLGLVLLPVGFRNLYVGGQFTLTTSQMGPNFYIGNNPSADGTYASISLSTGEKQFEQLEATRLAEQAAGHALSPGQVSSYWLGRSVDYIRSRPLDWVRLLWRKWLIVWNVREIEDSDDFYLYQRWSWLLSWLAWIDHFGVVAPLAAAGVILTWRQWRRLWVLYALVLSFAASVALFFVFGRYRFPLVPFLTLFAAGGVVEATALYRKRQFKALAAPLAALLAAVVYVHWPVMATGGPSASGYNYLANAYDEQGKIDDAIESARAALAIDPTNGVAHYNLGTFYLKKRRIDEAIRHYQDAVKTYPRYINARVNLGNALVMKGRLPDAAEQYDEALKIDPAENRVRLTAAEVSVMRGRLDEAQDHFERILKIDPNAVLAHQEFGKLLLAKGNLDGAVEHFRAAIRLQPRWADPYASLAEVLTLEGKAAEAAQVRQQALALQQQQQRRP
ncbi:MAG TPA: tetratricopeptide repeat protein [Candidatus Methylomirabilis sp.]|nr:tetratricopeptide repeat protein [Candidatus Methylomirabilis sp.]